MKQILGFDYRLGRRVTHDSREWKQLAAEIISSGGFRRVEHGETFLHASNGLLAAEVYGYVPAPKVAA